MIFVHGVNHNAQIRGEHADSKNASALESFVRAFHLEHHLDAIAEEYSTEACEKYSVRETICRALARELGLDSIYCDPTAEERNALGIPSQCELQEKLMQKRGCRFLSSSDCAAIDKQMEGYFRLREEFWIEKLLPAAGSRVLFVCGTKHIASVVKLLESVGVDARTV